MAALERIYTFLFDGVTVTAIQDLFYVKASATNGIAVRRISISAAAVTASAEIKIRLKRLPATVTVGSGGSAPTIQKVQSRLAVPSLSSVRANDTVQATTSGTAAPVAVWNWNVLQDFLEVPATEPERWEADLSEAMVCEISATPASTVLSGFMVFEET